MVNFILTIGLSVGWNYWCKQKGKAKGNHI